MRLGGAAASWANAGRRAPGQRCAYCFTSPAKSIARWTSGFFINHFHTNPLRRFSALSSVIPTSMPITLGATHPLLGLNASRKAVPAVDPIAILLLHSLQRGQGDIRS